MVKNEAPLPRLGLEHEIRLMRADEEGFVTKVILDPYTAINDPLEAETEQLTGLAKLLEHVTPPVHVQ